MMYLRAWIVHGEVAHCHCSDLPITHDVIEVTGASFIVTASLETEYTDAAQIFGQISWDGNKLSGFDFISYEVVET